jgi:hypothetical protein
VLFDDPAFVTLILTSPRWLLTSLLDELPCVIPAKLFTPAVAAFAGGDPSLKAENIASSGRDGELASVKDEVASDGLLLMAVELSS